MTLGNSLYKARKRTGLSQEEVAEKLGVSRQTISKWETNETLPVLRQSKQMAQLYHLSLDELIDFDVDVKEIEEMIEHANEEKQKKMDWTKLWGKKYPILTVYKEEVDISQYAPRLREMLGQLESDYHYSALDAMLVLKDILAHMWNDQ